MSVAIDGGGGGGGGGSGGGGDGGPDETHTGTSLPQPSCLPVGQGGARTLWRNQHQHDHHPIQRPGHPSRTRHRNAFHKMHYVKTKLRVGGGGDHDDQWDYTSSEEEAEAPTQLFTDNQLNAINAIVRDPSIVRGGEIAGKDGHIDNELVDDTMAGFLRGFLNERWTAQLLAKLKSTNTYIALIVAAWLLVGFPCSCEGAVPSPPQPHTHHTPSHHTPTHSISVSIASHLSAHVPSWVTRSESNTALVHRPARCTTG